MRALTKLTTTETRLFFRDPIAVALGLGLGPLLLVILGFVPEFQEPIPDAGGLRVIDFFTPIVIALTIASIALIVLPQLLAGYRAKGVLRRMRTTPVRPTALLGAQLLMCTGLTVAVVLAVLAIARLAFDVPLPQNPVGYLLAFVLASLATGAIGMLIAAVAAGASAANGFGMVAYFPLLFLAGLWIPRESMDELLRVFSDFSPLGAGVASLQHAAVGEWPQLLHVAVMLGWTIVAGALASRFFRWE